MGILSFLIGVDFIAWISIPHFELPSKNRLLAAEDAKQFGICGLGLAPFKRLDRFR